jgi:hypothetical protein
MQGHFEAKKHAIRQTQDGWVVSFVVHPKDMTPEFAAAPLGTILMIGYAEVGESPLPEPALAPPAKPVKAPDSTKSERGKERYAQADDMERARTRASLLCKDMAFRRWIVRDIPEIAVASTDMAVDILRDEIGVKSRSEIASDERAYQAFLALETEYLQSQGRLAEARG